MLTDAIPKESRILSRPAIRSLRLLPALILFVAACGGCSTFPLGGWSTPGPSVAGPAVAVVSTAAPSSSPTAEPSASPSPSPNLLPSPTPSATPVASKATVPILYYHRVQPVPKTFSKWSKARQKHFLEYDALPKAFVAQLDWLAANGYTTILPGDLASHWDHGTPLPPKPVIITFDDGSRSWTKRVMQALQKRGMVAEFYLTLDAIKADAIDWGDIRKLVAAGNGIGAHDVHHVQIAGLPGGHDPPVATMWKEINDIRAVILAHVGVAPDSMSYVGGGYDKTLLRLVAGAGYTTARSINRGVVQTVDRRYRLRVVRIGANDDVVDPQKQTLRPGLPTFAARMRGVSDLK
jgi:peptidoglycan/xylan/chitin deacetylase (PgdA/CDA1 family)